MQEHITENGGKLLEALRKLVLKNSLPLHIYMKSQQCSVCTVYINNNSRHLLINLNRYFLICTLYI